MKIIKDIRLFRSEKQDEYGEPIICTFSFDRNLTAVVHRIVMKLREWKFVMGEFDHLYINFTTCDMDGKMHFSDKADIYHTWYRYCSVKIRNDLYNRLGTADACHDIIRMIGDVLTTYFATEDFDETKIRFCIQQAVEQGPNMLMKFKEKITSKRKAVIFLRYLDNCRYYPLLRVCDEKGDLLLEKNLPETSTLDGLGEIQVSQKKVTIKPRKNMFAIEMEPLSFEY